MKKKRVKETEIKSVQHEERFKKVSERERERQKKNERERERTSQKIKKKTESRNA